MKRMMHGSDPDDSSETESEGSQSLSDVDLFC